MGRPKGSRNKISNNIDLEELAKSSGKIGNIDNTEGPAKFKRDANGLLVNIKYVFDESGAVNWRAMLKNDHLYVNEGYFKSRGKDVPRSPEGLRDNQVLITLSGIKEIARLRGFNHISYYTEKCEANHVAVNCTVGFIGNYETGGVSVSFQDMANATLDNTSSFATKFLETIACNRAFVRCVRNFLNIHIVGYDEIDHSSKKSTSGSNTASLTPQGVLQKHCEESGVNSFDDFLQKLRDWWTSGEYQNDSASDWSGYDDIPAKEARLLIKLLKGS
tara:strand:- start:2439 stop:3263 length:825 start_codon:yes stop_codon:yes gene_type:complete